MKYLLKTYSGHVGHGLHYIHIRHIDIILAPLYIYTQ